jgi:hypothetical protein
MDENEKINFSTNVPALCMFLSQDNVDTHGGILSPGAIPTPWVLDRCCCTYLKIVVGMCMLRLLHIGDSRLDPRQGLSRHWRCYGRLRSSNEKGHGRLFDILCLLQALRPLQVLPS